MLSTLARPTARRGLSASVAWSPIDDRFYNVLRIAGRSDAGINVLPENALQIAVVYRAINVLAHAIASIPLVIYRKLPDDGREKAVDHPQYALLHDQPNAFQTSFRWRYLLMVQKILYGNHYSEIIPGSRGIAELRPLAPAATRIVDQLPDGRFVYLTREVRIGFGGGAAYGPERTILQDYILHVRGLSINGFSGIPLTQAARNAMGLHLAAERHGSMFLRNGAQLSGVLSTDATLDEKQRKENEDAWLRQHGGPSGSGGTPVLDRNLKYTPIASTNKDSQWIEARSFQIEEVLRFIGVPGVLCGYADKTATYASAEQFFLSFVTHTVRPETESIATELNFSVVTDSENYFADFILEGLLRGDIKTRYVAHQMAITSGWKSRNEVRRDENLNRGPDALDEFLEPMNMQEAGADPADGTAPTPAPVAARRALPSAQNERLSAIARRGVERLVRKEISAIAGSVAHPRGAAKRFAGDTDGWKHWLVEFYTEHAQTIVADLGVSIDEAARYCTAQRARLELSLAASDDFFTTSTTALLALLEAP